MSHSTWWQRDCHTGSALWSPAECLRSRPPLPPGLWSWWPLLSACDYQCLWTPRRMNPCQCAPAWWTAPPGQLWHSGHDWSGNKAGEERECGFKEIKERKKKECLKRTERWGVNRKHQQGAILTGYINSFIATPCICVHMKRDTGEPKGKSVTIG